MKNNKVAFASDHAGFELKESLKMHLEKKGYEIVDLGTYSTESTNYAKYGHKLGDYISKQKAGWGVIVCGSGVGIAIAANRHKGVRAARVWNIEDAKLTRLHNDANVISFGERMKYKDNPNDMVDAFLNAPFEGGRHKIRIKTLDE